LSGYCDILAGHAAKALEGTFIAKEFFDSCANGCRFTAQLLQLIRMIQQQPNRAREKACRGFMASD